MTIRVLGLDAAGQYLLYWKFNDTHITFETHVNTRGYIGFGISPKGKMYPSDNVIGWVASNGDVHLSVSLLVFTKNI
jgi:hypothetical protein